MDRASLFSAAIILVALPAPLTINGLTEQSFLPGSRSSVAGRLTSIT